MRDSTNNECEEIGNSMTGNTSRQVRFLDVVEEEAGQRLDNYLLRHVEGVPKTRVYRAIRKGEVRVNKGRSKPEYRMQKGDVVRVPPWTETGTPATATPSKLWEQRIRAAVLLEHPDFLAINKPSGLAVHGGSGVRLGLIESLRVMFPECRYLELVHRLDRDTSGVVLVAKNATALRALHSQLRNDQVDKRYAALVVGKWPAYQKSVSAPLAKRHTSSGERIVKVAADGKISRTDVAVLERLPGATLIEAKPITGRTHQIRVHAMHTGYPILGDSKYETDSSRRLAGEIALKRLFLHARAIAFELGGERYQLACPLDDELESVLERLRSKRQG
jgi:23S rRNA pseudouridine955/2504/2580 synthase